MFKTVGMAVAAAHLAQMKATSAISSGNSTSGLVVAKLKLVTTQSSFLGGWGARVHDTHLVTGFAVSIIHSEMDEGTERREVGLTEMLNNVGTLALY